MVLSRFRMLFAFMCLLVPGSWAWGQASRAEVDCTYQDQELAAVVSDLANKLVSRSWLDPALKGKISLSLGRVPLQEAMEEVAALAGGYAGVTRGRVYLAVRRSQGTLLPRRSRDCGHPGWAPGRR